MTGSLPFLMLVLSRMHFQLSDTASGICNSSFSQWYMQFFFQPVKHGFVTCRLFLSTRRNCYIKPDCYQGPIAVETRNVVFESNGIQRNIFIWPCQTSTKIYQFVPLLCPGQFLDHLYPGSQAQSVSAYLERLLSTITWPALCLTNCSTGPCGHASHSVLSRSGELFPGLL